MKKVLMLLTVASLSYADVCQYYMHNASDNMERIGYARQRGANVEVKALAKILVSNMEGAIVECKRTMPKYEIDKMKVLRTKIIKDLLTE